MPPPNIKDVTDAKCPPDKPFKCLPYGTCHSFDSYCNKQHGDVVSCFPMEFKNNMTEILDWCRGEGKETFLNPGCHFACQYRFNSSVLNFAPEIQGSTRADCSNVVRDVTSCFPPDKGSNETELFNWCYDVVQQGNGSALISSCHSNSHSTIITHESSSAAESPTLLTAQSLAAVFAILFVASLILNIILLCKKYCCHRGSYSTIVVDSKSLDTEIDELSANQSEDEESVHRRRQRNFSQVTREQPRHEMQRSAGTRRNPGSAVSLPGGLSTTEANSRDWLFTQPGVNLRNSTGQARGQHLQQSEHDVSFEDDSSPSTPVDGGSRSSLLVPISSCSLPQNEAEDGPRAPCSPQQLDVSVHTSLDGGRSNVSEPQRDHRTPRNSTSSHIEME